MFKAVAPKVAYIFNRIISSDINIGSISLCCCTVWTILIYYDWQGLDLILPVWKPRFAPSVEVIQDHYLKEICFPGSYGLNPGRMQLDRPIHCWTFSWVPFLNPSFWTRIFGPVYLDPSIFTCPFGLEAVSDLNIFSWKWYKNAFKKKIVGSCLVKGTK